MNDADDPHGFGEVEMSRDEAFAAWVRMTPKFVVCALCDVNDGVPVSPDVLRLSMPHVETLRAILAS